LFSTGKLSAPDVWALPLKEFPSFFKEETFSFRSLLYFATKRDFFSFFSQLAFSFFFKERKGRSGACWAAWLPYDPILVNSEGEFFNCLP